MDENVELTVRIHCCDDVSTRTKLNTEGMRREHSKISEII